MCNRYVTNFPPVNLAIADLRRQILVLKSKWTNANQHVARDCNVRAKSAARAAFIEARPGAARYRWLRFCLKRTRVENKMKS